MERSEAMLKVVHMVQGSQLGSAGGHCGGDGHCLRWRDGLEIRLLLRDRLRMHAVGLECVLLEWR